MDITVLLGDPRLPYRYNLSNRFEPHDYLALRRLQEALDQIEGYRFRFLDDHERLWQRLEQEERPALVLNFCNTGYRNDFARQQHVAALLDMLRLPYAGAGPECMVLCHNKFLVYALAANLGIPVPRQALVGGAQQQATPRSVYPAFIKPNNADGSFGITSSSLVHCPEEAERQLLKMMALLPNPQLLIQEYLPGPEYSMGVLGNPRIGYTVLPPLQVDFSGLPKDLPPIMTYESKVDPRSPYWQHVRFCPATLADHVRQRMIAAAKLMFEWLGCRDYARVDFRCGADGEPRLLDINAHPVWAEGGMLATMAGYLHRSYPQFLESIIAVARTRLQL
ncbi:MAG: D-alanine--D-alanine ligase [Nitrococcus mobilis]|nr:D-alanine--D-alanine ligase [Nitrococcus mobilis]